MDIKELLGKGYFPKELPPAFTTKYFSDKLTSIEDSWQQIKEEIRQKYKESKCINYSIPRLYYSRRNLEIPNPLHQSILAKSICDNWTDIYNFYKGSRISTSKPTINSSNERAVKTEKTFSEFKKACLLDSFDKLYEVKTDISRFYPTTYTHVIPWALHTKVVAKSRRRDSALLGNTLDKNVRCCQANQTMGIPIGPDTSLIISEIITCEIDKILQKKLNSIKGYRYYDDYYFFVSTLEEAEKALKAFQYILTDFNLDINEEKTSIKKYPIPFDSEWSIQISSFSFRVREKSQETDIANFFSLAFQFAKENPKDAVLRYAVKRLEYIRILDRNWPFFESLLLKTVLSEPLTLPEITRILITYGRLVDKNKVEKVIEEIIKIHVPKGHSFEVSWALWLAKTFKLQIRRELAKDVFDSNDVISILIALDLKNNSLIDPTIDITSLIDELTEDSLFEEKWLLTYESIVKNWLVPPSSNPVDKNSYFKILKNNKVVFYDGSKQLNPIKFKKPKGKVYKKKRPSAAEFFGYTTNNIEIY